MLRLTKAEKDGKHCHRCWRSPKPSFEDGWILVEHKFDFIHVWLCPTCKARSDRVAAYRAECRAWEERCRQHIQRYQRRA